MGITVEETNPVIVHKDGSVCVLWNVHDNKEVRAAGADLLDTIRQDGPTIVVFVDQWKATVLSVRRDDLVAPEESGAPA